MLIKGQVTKNHFLKIIKQKKEKYALQEIEHLLQRKRSSFSSNEHASTPQSVGLSIRILIYILFLLVLQREKGAVVIHEGGETERMLPQEKCYLSHRL